MDYRKKLFQWKDPFDTEGSKDAFCKAMKENCAFQYKNCPEYRTILDEKGFSPEDIKDYDDLAKLPFLPTVFLKHHRIFSMPEHKRLIRATSSGTSGKYSEIGMEFGVPVINKRISITPAAIAGAAACKSPEDFVRVAET